MGYIDQNLMPGEEVTFRTKLHWYVFFWPLIIIIASVLLVATGGDALIGSVLLFFGLATVVGAAVRYSTSEFAITNRRVMMKTGFIRRNSLELLLDKIEGVGVDQSILGRILGHGTITVSGTGGMKTPFKTIAQPMEFRQRVYSHISPE